MNKYNGQKLWAISLCKICTYLAFTSRLTVVSLEAKKKQAVCDKRVSYLHVTQLWNLLTL